MNSITLVGQISRTAVIKTTLSSRIAEYYVRVKAGAGCVHCICFQHVRSDAAETWAKCNLVEGQEITVIGYLAPREFERGGPIAVTVVSATTHGWEVDQPVREEEPA